MKYQELNELNERLLIKLGWTKDDDNFWIRPDGKTYYNYDSRSTMPLLTSSIEDCFLWLMPELRKRGCQSIKFQYNKRNVSCTLVLPGYTGVCCSTDELSSLCKMADIILGGKDETI